MYRIAPIEPIDYLIIGHLTKDLTPDGPRLGGTACYASLTARALGLRVGIITACEDCYSAPELEQSGIRVVGIRADTTTTFENIPTPTGRVQYLHSLAPSIDLSMVPEPWLRTPIVHLGPIAREVDPMLTRSFSSSFVGLTPQGWMRSWDETGLVHFSEWPESSFVLQNASAAILSIHDVHGDESIIEEMASASRVLAVTEGPNGARVYWNGDLRRFRPPKMEEIDSTGAGDIFAAAFFFRLQTTRDPWEAGRFATQLAAWSVVRVGLSGVPTADEIQASMTEIIE
jgi:sugar/nucleoside kinase (ribokinase family)